MQNTTLTTFLSLFVLCSCSSSSVDQKIKTEKTKNKKDASAQSITTNTTVDKPKILGIWWNSNDKDAPHASFAINDSTIFYPDQEGQSEFKYQIKGDSLVIYFDGFVNSSKIDKLTGDLLELTTDGEKSTFMKSKK
jgi:hypothetical protein